MDLEQACQHNIGGEIMEVEVQILQDIPKDQIEKFEDRVVYNIAVNTREFTKSSNSYPYLSGDLQRSEISAPITGSDKQYGLSGGVSYANRVYKMENVNWTNKETQPHWYITNFKIQGNTIITNAVHSALKEV